MEKKNNIILAPSTSQVTEIYNLWKESYTGTLTDFYKFMVSPSIERERFIISLAIDYELIGSFIAINITLQ